jgi:acetoacetate decarboxylase
MKIEDVKNNAFAIPFASPSYPRGPFRFYNREFVIVTYRTDMERCARWCPSRWKSSNRW